MITSLKKNSGMQHYAVIGGKNGSIAIYFYVVDAHFTLTEPTTPTPQKHML